MSRPKSAAVNDVDIADILDQKYPYYIDNGKGDIDPPLIQSDRVGLPVNEKLSYSIILLLEHNILPTSIPKALSLQLDIWPVACMMQAESSQMVPGVHSGIRLLPKLIQMFTVYASMFEERYWNSTAAWYICLFHWLSNITPYMRCYFQWKFMQICGQAFGYFQWT